MDSPFPGMDPYLERHWKAVHTQLVGAASRAINRQLPRGLVARPEENLSVVSDDDDEGQLLHRVVPAARVFEHPATGTEMATAVMAPFKLVIDSEPATERYLKILNAEDERLITVVEFISPSNKHGAGAREYAARRGEMLDAGVNVVEIDLVRQGNWRRLLAPHRCPREAVSEYRAALYLAAEPAATYLYPLQLRQRLVPIPIPLRAGDRPVTLDVQPLLRDIYVDDKYEETLNYATPLDPPLSPEDAAWADALLRSAGRR